MEKQNHHFISFYNILHNNMNNDMRQHIANFEAGLILTGAPFSAVQYTCTLGWVYGINYDDSWTYGIPRATQIHTHHTHTAIQSHIASRLI